MGDRCVGQGALMLLLSALLSLLLATCGSEALVVSARNPKNFIAAADQEEDNLLNKITLTQKNYIQFIKYLIEVPRLPSFTFCLWMKSLNMTNPQPIFSYSRDEKERYARVWISPPGSGADGGADEGEVSGAAHINLRIHEEPVASVPIPDMRVGRWHHTCLHWTSGMDAEQGMWLLFFDGGLRGKAVYSAKGDPEAVLPAGGEVAVGQELTDFDQGLDDGFEGELFGFNLATGPWEGLGKTLYETSYNQCTLRGGGSPPATDGKSTLLVDWAKTPIRAYGGLLVSPAKASCGNF
ncbi:C-reactive protein 1.4-like [Ischnura elegans]|uniref:C-reactive protein 1.4-like n=1 Tax=Ischnura elegans TaxID=197161 RepID=UPI001ED886DD|nr:C-reactive protein 1.4-like [Ischnura elegans]